MICHHDTDNDGNCPIHPHGCALHARVEATIRDGHYSVLRAMIALHSGTVGRIALEEITQLVRSIAPPAAGSADASPTPVIGVPEPMLIQLTMLAATASGYLRNEHPDLSDQLFAAGSAVSRMVADRPQK